MNSSVIDRFRFFCMAEGFSWIALLAAMVVKYGFGHAEAVRARFFLAGTALVVLVLVVVLITTPTGAG